MYNDENCLRFETTLTNAFAIVNDMNDEQLQALYYLCLKIEKDIENLIKENIGNVVRLRQLLEYCNRLCVIAVRFNLREKVVLKTVEPHFTLVKSEEKTFEMRKEDDRKFWVGQLLKLMKYDPETETFSGDSVIVEITHILRKRGFDAVPEGYAILSINVIQ